MYNRDVDSIMKSIILACLFLIVVTASLAGAKALQIGTLIQTMSSMGMPASSVSTTKVATQQWETLLHSVGELEAVQGVVVSSELSGRVVEINFTPGSLVEKGQVLVKQDTSQEQAQLRAAKASIQLTKTTFDRDKNLLKKKVISQSQFDVSKANYTSAIAQADNIQAVIDKKTITAPFAGRLGLRQINLGSDLSPGVAIVTLQTLDPIYANFFLPQQSIPKFNVSDTVRLTTDAVPNKTYTGDITALNAEVDTRTRSIRIQATISNKDEKLLPGMFAQIHVVAPTVENVLTVPQTAVAYATFGDSVYVITNEQNDNGESVQKVTQKFVKLGRRQGDFIEILAGVEEGEEVVSAGVFKLFNGAPVSVNNTVQPDYKTQPTPENT